MQAKRQEPVEQGQGDSTIATTDDSSGSGKAPAAPEDLETEEAKKLVEKMTESGATSRDEETTKTVVSVAARAVGSLTDTEFDISFNPDVYQDHVRHAEPEV